MHNMQYIRIHSAVDNMEFIANRSEGIRSAPLSIVEVGHSFPENGKHADMTVSCFQLHYIISGTGSFRSNELSAGTGFLVLPGEKQDMRVIGDDFEQYWVNFAGISASSLLEECGIPTVSHIFRYDTGSGGRDFVRTSLADVFASDPDTHPLKHTHTYLVGLLYQLLAVNTLKKQIPLTRSEQYVQTVCAHIRRSYAENLTVESLSRTVGLSGKYLSRIFAAVTGTTMIAYLTRIRMEAAGHLLTHTDKSIGEIARDVGYEDPLYFSKAFRTHCGVSPSGWKCRHGG